MVGGNGAAVEHTVHQQLLIESQIERLPDAHIIEWWLVEVEAEIIGGQTGNFVEISLAECEGIHIWWHIGVIVLTSFVVIVILGILAGQEGTIYLSQGDVLVPGALPVGI